MKEFAVSVLTPDRFWLGEAADWKAGVLFSNAHVSPRLEDEDEDFEDEELDDDEDDDLEDDELEDDEEDDLDDEEEDDGSTGSGCPSRPCCCRPRATAGPSRSW